MPPHTLIVLDTETTGLDFKTEQIIEIAAVKLVDDVITDSFQSLVKPTVPIRSSSQKVHGISEEDLVAAPGMEDVLPQFLAFTGDLPYVAHSAYNDYTFINQACKKHGEMGFTNHRIDSYELFRQLFPEEPSHGLGAMLARFGLPPMENAHRAMADTMALAQVYPALARLYEQKMAWRFSQLPHVPFLLERYGQLKEAQRMLQFELSELKEIFRLYFEEGGDVITSTSGERLSSERKRNYSIDDKALWDILKDTPYAQKVFKLQAKNLSRQIPDMEVALKTAVLETRTLTSESLVVQFSKTASKSNGHQTLIANDADEIALQNLE